MKLFLTLILSATILTGISPAEAKITDAVHRALQYLEEQGVVVYCLDGGKKVYRNMHDSEGKPVNYFCCKDGLEWNYQTGQYDTLDNRICGCPGGGHPTEAINVCCKDGRIWDEKTESYSEADTLGRCSTCPYDGIPASNNLDCCKDGKLLDSDTGEYTKDDTEGVCKCPEGKESVWTRKKDANGGYVKVCCPKGQWADSNGTCCENGASRDENDLRTCCKEGEKSVLTGKESADGWSVTVCCPKGQVWDGKACVQPVCEVGSVWCDEQTGKCYSV